MVDMNQSVIDVRNLKVEFPGRRGTVTALSDISLSIRPGEILGVVGESGAGKSMTGLAIQGLLEKPGHIADGEIWLGSRRIDQLDDRAMESIRGREIGAIFQDPLTSLNPLFTVGAQLVETIRQHLPLSKADARARAVQLLKDVGIPSPADRVDHYPHQFSGGMRQRVVIALALAASRNSSLPMSRRRRSMSRSRRRSFRCCGGCARKSRRRSCLSPTTWASLPRLPTVWRCFMPAG